MPSIEFERAHGMGLAAARGAAQRVADDMQDIFSVDTDWRGDELHFSSTGVSGVLRVLEDRIRLEATLGFLFSAYKPRIEAQLAANFDRYFS